MLAGIRLVFGAAALVVVVTAGDYAAQTSERSISDLLTRYEAGEYDDAAAIAARVTDLVRFRKEFDVVARQWMLAAGPGSVERRRALAATFVLEVARSWIVALRQAMDQPPPAASSGGRGRTTAGPRVKPAWPELRLLIEWACELLRSAPVPSPSERLWVLASLAITPDAIFTIGPPPGTPQDRFNELSRQYGAALGHGLHFRSRPSVDSRLGLVHLEARFGTGGIGYLISRRLEFTVEKFAEIQREAAAILARRNQPGLRAMDASGQSLAFRPSAADTETLRLAELLGQLREMGRELVALNPSGDARAAAQLHLGAIALCLGDREAALKHLGDAERHAQTTYDRYLSSYLQGRVYELQNRVAEAEASYRRALDAVPRTHSGVTALARLLFVDGRRSDASALVAAMHASPAQAGDPWIQFSETGCDRWPDLIIALRETLK